LQLEAIIQNNEFDLKNIKIDLKLKISELNTSMAENAELKKNVSDLQEDVS